ncbi:hypothetical protein ALQ73_200099 [Pseudomonas savastanoi pv. glycinea]|uniref:Uncharacterized protein n=1 Tax=Pseudomonas savastanoi pv. glycinea TaxID=318 RepID=A0A3M3FZC3_PSESG|nr:hypothetical protein ALQ73_200099 [Pseudomonas savastanoi pv. glycinea]
MRPGSTMSLSRRLPVLSMFCGTALRSRPVVQRDRVLRSSFEQARSMSAKLAGQFFDGTTMSMPLLCSISASLPDPSSKPV